MFPSTSQLASGRWEGSKIDACADLAATWNFALPFRVWVLIPVWLNDAGAHGWCIQGRILGACFKAATMERSPCIERQFHTMGQVGGNDHSRWWRCFPPRRRIFCLQYHLCLWIHVWLQQRCAPYEDSTLCHSRTSVEGETSCLSAGMVLPVYVIFLLSFRVPALHHLRFEQRPTGSWQMWSAGQWRFQPPALGRPLVFITRCSRNPLTGLSSVAPS